MTKFELRTKDVNEAAYVWCDPNVEFIRQETVERANGSLTVFFIFSGLSREDFTSLRQAFYNHKARVEPKMFSSRLSDVRDILNEVLRKMKRK